MGAEDIEFGHRMSDADQLMWTIEKDPLLRSTITTVIFLDAPPDKDLLTARVDRATRVIPRLRQRVRSNPLSIAPPRWEVDPNFDLSYHLRWAKVPGKRTDRDVLDMAEPIAMEGFDRARPLWQFLAVEGIKGNKGALIVKLHHAITDGVGGVALMMELLDLERSPATQPEMPEEPPAKALTQAERFVDAAVYETKRSATRTRGAIGGSMVAAARSAADPLGESAKAVEAVASAARLLAPATEPLSPVLTDRSLSVHFERLTISLSEAKAAAKLAGGKLNDAFLAGVAGGLALYHQGHDQPVDAVRMSMPINTRNDKTEGQAGNQFAPARFPLPLDIDDPIERMQQLRQLVNTNRDEPALDMIDAMAGVLNRLPTSVTTSIFGSMLKGIDVVTSNVPGAPIEVYLAGGRMESQFAFGPMAGAAINVTLMSYIDELHIGINTDPAAVADPEFLRECLEDAFEQVLAVTG